MTELYEVTVERTLATTIWVEAEDRDTARIEARELADGMPADEWDDVGAFTLDLFGPHADLPGRVEQVWVGGEHGRWVHGDDYDAGVRS